MLWGVGMFLITILFTKNHDFIRKAYAKMAPRRFRMTVNDSIISIQKLSLRPRKRQLARYSNQFARDVTHNKQYDFTRYLFSS